MATIQRISVGVAVGLLTAAIAYGAAAPKKEPPPHIKAYLAQRPTPAEKVAAIKNLQKTLGQYRQTLARIRRGKISRVQTQITVGATGVITFPSREARSARAKQAQKQVTALLARLRGLKDGTGFWFAAMPSRPGERPTVGAIGRLPDPEVRVQQIIDGQNMLVTSSAWDPLVILRRMGDMQPYLNSGGVRLEYFWVKGFPTKGIIDGRRRNVHDVFEVTGTKTYETVASGSKTVFVIEPVDLVPYLPQKKSPKTQKQ